MMSKSLQELRTEKGLTAKGLAAKAGTGIIVVSNIECGKANYENLTLKNTKKLADALKISLDEMYEVLKNTKPMGGRGWNLKKKEPEND